MSRPLRILAAVLALLPLFTGQVSANPYGDKVDARLLPGWRTPDGRHVAGLELTLADGWKTYWRSPGEAGVPPIFDWSASDNLAGVQVVWPRPEVFDLNGLRSIGYKHHVVLPLVLTPRDPAQAIRLSGDLSLGICEDVCVPMELHLSGLVPAGGGQRNAAIASAMAARPYSASEGRVSEVNCRVRPTRDGLQLMLDIAMPSAGGEETIVVESNDPAIWVTDATSSRDNGRLTGSAEVLHNTGGSFVLDRSGLTITVLGANHAVEIEGCGG